MKPSEGMILYSVSLIVHTLFLTCVIRGANLVFIEPIASIVLFTYFVILMTDASVFRIKSKRKIRCQDFEIQVLKEMILTESRKEITVSEK